MTSLLPPKDLRLIETFAIEADGTVHLWNRHLERLLRTAERFDIRCARETVEKAVIEAAGSTRLRARLTVGLAGDVHVETVPMPPIPQHWTARIAPERLRRDDPWLGVKTTQRAHYDRARKALPDGVDEWIFLNDRGNVCEGTITNIYAECGDELVTPPLSAGLLPGVMREELLATCQAHEADLTLDDLINAPALYASNALRGLIRIELKNTGQSSVAC